MPDPILIAGYWGVLFGIGTAVWLFIMGFVEPHKRLHKRAEELHQIVGSPDSGSADASREKRRLIQQKLKELETESQKKRRAIIRKMLSNAGSSLSVRMYWVLSLAIGLAVALGVYLSGFAPYLAGIAGVGGSLYLPRLYFKTRIGMRHKKFTAAFPDALEMIIRAVKSGLPVIEGLRMIGREFNEPIAGEFRRIVDSQKLGMSLPDALEAARDRIATAEFKYFSVVLDIQQRTGGNLAQTLTNLSNVLRGRAHLKDRIGALSSEARSSAMIIGGLPFLVSGLLTLMRPDYMLPLFTTDFGNILVLGCLSWMSIGILVMRQLMKITP